MENNKQVRVPLATSSGSYGYGWQQIWKYFLSFFAITLIVALAGGPFSVVWDNESDHSAGMVLLQIIGMAYGVLLLPVIKYGGDLLYLRGIRNEEMELGELFLGFRKNYLPIVLANLLKYALIIIGFLFFIVPGIILACRLIFVSYLVMDKNMEPVPALEKSWAMTKGHGWRIFGMAMLAIPIFIGGLICFLVGAFVAVMWIDAAFAALYHAVDLDETQRLDGNNHQSPISN